MSRFGSFCQCVYCFSIVEARGFGVKAAHTGFGRLEDADGKLVGGAYTIIEISLSVCQSVDFSPNGGLVVGTELRYGINGLGN